MAASVNQEERARQATLVVSITQYEWWLIRWSDNQIVCQVFIDHEGVPTGEEILVDCGGTIYAQWFATPPCQEVPGEDGLVSTVCTGLYLHFVGNRPAEKTIKVDLPQPEVFLTLQNCVPTLPENLCPQLPVLLLTGEEPLPNERMEAIHAELNGRSFTCEGTTCEVLLRPTSSAGMTLEFWADSSFGDTSQRFTALVRVIDAGVSTAPSPGGWYVDILSTQWRGRPIASCAQTWDAFPPLGGPPPWLSTPELPELLATEEPYQFLAGRLITAGLVDANGCPDGGLMPNGYANTCGLERALPLVITWQNQFDTRILEIAQQTGVPAQLLKNLFAQESQFWPGAFQDSEHFGLGQITSKGAEVLLLWNRSFFDQFCPFVLDASVCERGYLRLNETEQGLLRGALATRARSDCPECQEGIDLSHADLSVELFAQTLLANCEQVGQIVFNASRQTPGAESSYEDLWRFTLANYHAGPGCLSFAIHTAFGQGSDLTWSNVADNFTPACQGVVEYVNNIAR